MTSRLFTLLFVTAAVAAAACSDGAEAARSAASGGRAGSAATGGASNAGGSIGGSGASGAAGSAGVAGSGMAGSGGRAGASGSAGSAPVSGSSGSVGVGGAAGSKSDAGAAGEPEAGGSAGVAGTAGTAGASPLDVLVFSKTTEFRHESIPTARAALMTVATEQGWTFSATEDASVFADATLQGIDVVVFLLTSGDPLDDAEQAAFERFIRAGKGFVGIHSASDTEYDWPFYGELVGAYFREHPAIQQATVHVEDTAHPTMMGLPAAWQRTDEWYAFRADPRPNVHVLMTLDETTYAPGTSAMGADHPTTWCHDYEGGRAFYTALGHTSESYADPLFIGMLRRAIEWAATSPP